jgi:hypothetical protein
MALDHMQRGSRGRTTPARGGREVACPHMTAGSERPSPHMVTGLTVP